MTSREFLGVTNAAKAVTNIGLGLAYRFSDEIHILSGFRTDFSAAALDDSTLSMATWDIYHFSLGGVVDRKDSKIGVGLTFSYGRDKEYAQPVNFSQPTEAEFLFGATGKSTAIYTSTLLTVGFEKNY